MKNLIVIIISIMMLFILFSCQKATPVMIPVSVPEGFALEATDTPISVESIEEEWRSIDVPFCLGVGVPLRNAPAYDSGMEEPSLHIYRVIDRGRIVYIGNGFNSYGPLGPAHLIVCIIMTMRNEEVKNCNYSNGVHVKIHPATFVINMYSINSGELISSVEEEIPARCPNSWTKVIPGPTEFEINAFPEYTDYLAILGQ